MNSTQIKPLNIIVTLDENGMHADKYAVRSPKNQLIATCEMLLDPYRQQDMTENQHKVISADAAAAI